MPFTFVHPLAVLPLRRWTNRVIDWPALVIGSLVPDLGYYYPLHDYFTRDTHPLERLVTFNLPMGLVILGLFHLLRRPTVYLLPEPHRTPLEGMMRPVPLGPGFAIRAAASLLLGAALHIAWDSFTHANGFMVRSTPLLGGILFEVGNTPYHLYNLLQHLSSLGGALLLGVLYSRWVRKRPVPFEPSRSWRWWVWGAITIGALAYTIIMARPVDPAGPDVTVGDVTTLRNHGFLLLVTFIQGFTTLAAATAAGVGVWIRATPDRSRGAGTAPS